MDGITNSMEFEPTPGDSEGQEGSLVRCHAHDRDESDTTERLNSNNKQAQELYSAGFRGYQGRRRRQLKGDGGDRIWGCA